MSPLLARRLGLRIATRTACLMSAATSKPIVTKDPARNGQITIAPGEGVPHTATFIGFIHGLGDTNMGWIDVAGMLHTTAFPYVKFILPNAPTSPVTLNGGMAMPSWYDITSLDKREGQTCAGIEDSRETISRLVDEEVAAGMPLSRIVVGGFSQGGAMSLYTGLQYPGTLAGICVLSGYLPKDDGVSVSEEAKATPVAAFHGIEDTTVQIKWARVSADKCKALGVASYEMKEYEQLGHGASQEEIDDVTAWLKNVLPPM